MPASVPHPTCSCPAVATASRARNATVTGRLAPAQESLPRSVEASCVSLHGTETIEARAPVEPLPDRMRALAKTAPGPGCELVEVPVPTPGPADILVQVAAGGICGTDLHITHRFPIERFNEAFGLLESGEAGKVILTIEH